MNQHFRCGYLKRQVADERQVMLGKLDETTKTNQGPRSVLLVMFLLALVCGPSSSQGQCPAKGYPLDRILWRGTFDFKVSGGSSDGICECSVSTSAKGSFRYIYVASGSSQMIPSNVVATVNWIDHCDCGDGTYNGHADYGSGAVTDPGNGVLIYIRPDCTYSVGMGIFVPGTVTNQVCTQPDAPASVELFAPGRLLNIDQAMPGMSQLYLPPFGEPLVGGTSFTLPSGFYCSDGPENYSVSWNIVPLRLKITSVETPSKISELGRYLDTFISTDPITLEATLTPPEANAEVQWTVRGLKGGAISEGLPSQEVHPTDSKGVSTFTFTPDSSAFRALRHLLWTGGSLTANPPIAFEVTAELTRDGVTLKSRLSEESALGKLEQDERDTLRQEYVDYGYAVPARNDLQSDPSFVNSGNYRYGSKLDSLQSHYQAVSNAYHRTTVVVNGNNVALPFSTVLDVKLGYGNPQKLKAIGSCDLGADHPHLLGKALDLEPDPVEVVIGQTRVQLDDVTLYAHLFNAGTDAGGVPSFASGCEWVTSPGSVNHVHISWSW